MPRRPWTKHWTEVPRYSEHWSFLLCLPHLSLPRICFLTAVCVEGQEAWHQKWLRGKLTIPWFNALFIGNEIWGNFEISQVVLIPNTTYISSELPSTTFTFIIDYWHTFSFSGGCSLARDFILGLVFIGVSSVWSDVFFDSLVRTERRLTYRNADTFYGTKW